MTNNSASSPFKKHPYFDLMLPSNEMLEKHVGAAVIERSVRHEWPLSCVERIVFGGGVEKYCKTMRAPSMEIAAYSTLHSPLLVRAMVLAESSDSGVLLLDSFAGSHLTKEVVEQDGLARFIDSLRHHLANIQGDGPVFVDLSTVDKIQTKMNEMLERLRRRFGQNVPSQIDPELIDLAERCVASREVQESFVQDAIYTNGDLSAANILVSANEMRVIDWQFPRVASFKVEGVNLCTSLGIEPRDIFQDSVVAAAILCKVRWFAECADVWLQWCDYKEEISALLGVLGDLRVKS
jgi:hypothetical protein